MENAGDDAGFYYGALPTDDVQGRVVRDGNFVAVQWYRKDTAGSIESAPIVNTKLTGVYNLPNIMAAVATGIVFGLTDEEIGQGLIAYEPTNNRSEVQKKGSNTFILDSYNANPSSMEVAITNLMGTKAQNRSVILGEMLELGDISDKEHQAVCDRLKSLQLKRVCLVGNEFMRLKKDYSFNFFENVDELNEWLKKHPFDQETTLIKGSRKNKLENALLETFE
jgi:UDP-N-acetylmuramoyl-tripeptide--D-alanyl-D-alanine ligase